MSEKTEASALTEAALAYARRGLHVFPLKERDKTPAFRGWQSIATINPATIVRWWRARPYNIGVACGAASNLLVVDDDGNQDGVLDGLPPTPSIAAKRGVKLLFRHIDGVKNWVGRLGDHIDIRTNGGLVVMPPSIHPEGVRYRWLVEGDPVDAPQWLVERLRDLAKPRNSERALAAASLPAPGRFLGRGYGQAALWGEVDAVAVQTQPGRNARLNIAAFNLGRLAGGGELDPADILPPLLQACERNGLLVDDGERACMATIHSGMSAGMQRPRSRRAA